MATTTGKKIAKSIELNNIAIYRDSEVVLELRLRLRQATSLAVFCFAVRDN